MRQFEDEKFKFNVKIMSRPKGEFEKLIKTSMVGEYDFTVQEVSKANQNEGSV